MKHITQDPKALAAQETINKLAAALRSVDDRLEQIHATLRNDTPIQRSKLAQALDMVAGKPATPTAPAELLELEARREALAAGLTEARAEHRDILKTLEVEFNASRTAAYVKTLRGIQAGLEGTLEALQALEAFRQDAAAQGVDANAGGYSTDLDELMQDPLAQYLRTVRDLADEAEDRTSAAGSNERIVPLMTMPAYGIEMGKEKALPGPLARMLVRMGWAERQSNAARLAKMAQS